MELARTLLLVALTVLPWSVACSSEDGGGGEDDACEVDGRTGRCDPFADDGGCLSPSILCRCVIEMDDTPSTYKRLDCAADCQKDGHATGICVANADWGALCGCQD